ncbi:MAG: tRNA pseudouridine(38-40) synthase TruA [Roseburia sp.]|nr:tRNA pseudouridine(38-40) synthase TruA [Roseburia sp.]
MHNIRLVIQYEGTRYQGWQRQAASDNTIQGKLEQLLSRMCGEPIELMGSGRTDAGVHALGQVANFHTKSEMTPEEMRTYINSYLPEDIAVIEVAEAAPRFHSRLNAVGKCYRYLVQNGPVRDVFRRRYELEISEPLNVEAMRQAAQFMCGEHDFKAFTSAKKGKKQTVRRIDRIEITENADGQPGLISFTFQGNGFLYHMVRIMMGTLLEVGSKERSPENVKEVLRAGERARAGRLAPAKGLTLVKVFYD